MAGSGLEMEAMASNPSLPGVLGKKIDMERSYKEGFQEEDFFFLFLS